MFDRRPGLKVGGCALGEKKVFLFPVFSPKLRAADLLLRFFTLSPLRMNSYSANSFITSAYLPSDPLSKLVYTSAYLLLLPHLQYTSFYKYGQLRSNKLSGSARSCTPISSVYPIFLPAPSTALQQGEAYEQQANKSRSVGQRNSSRPKACAIRTSEHTMGN